MQLKLATMIVTMGFFAYAIDATPLMNKAGFHVVGSDSGGGGGDVEDGPLTGTEALSQIMPSNNNGHQGAVVVRKRRDNLPGGGGLMGDSIGGGGEPSTGAHGFASRDRIA